MKISTTTGTFARMYNDEVAIAKLAQAGFEAMDYSMFVHNAETGIYNQKGFEKHAERIKAVADACGISFGQIHAQMPSPSYPDYIARQELWDKLAVNTIITAAIVDCPYIVVHPLIMLDRLYDRKYQENFDANLDYYGRMKPYLKEYGVKVAIENMWHFDDEIQKIVPTVCSTAEEMIALADALGDEFVFCLDVGHTALTGNKAEDMVRKLGSRLKTLHIHDVNGFDDSHDIPFNGNQIPMMFPENENKIDWDAFAKSLKEIGYDGTFNLEADCFPKKFPAELREDATAFMAKVSKYFVNKYEL